MCQLSKVRYVRHVAMEITTYLKTYKIVISSELMKAAKLLGTWIVYLHQSTVNTHIAIYLTTHKPTFIP